MSQKHDEILARRQAIVPRGLPRLSEIVVAAAKGAELTDVDGQVYIDFATGIGVMGVGHSHPAILEAVRTQAELLQHACIHVATYESYVALCERLAGLLPHGPSTKVMLVNSGAEAVENAVKIARQATRRGAVLCYTEAFHGRTLLAMSLTSKVAYKSGCGPFASSVYRIPYPNPLLRSGGLDEAAFVAQELKRLEETFTHTVAPDQLAAIVIEVVQGEGGIVPCPHAYMRGLREICDTHGIMLIADEVQTGLCRTGRWAAYQHTGVVPDLSTWAKALGGGLPISAVLGKAQVMDAALPGTIGSTFGGNPVACAAALATLELMERERLAERAIQIGARIQNAWERLQAGRPSWEISAVLAP